MHASNEWYNWQNFHQYAPVLCNRTPCMIQSVACQTVNSKQRKHGCSAKITVSITSGVHIGTDRNPSQREQTKSWSSCEQLSSQPALHVMLLRQDIYYNALTTAVCTTNYTLTVLSMKPYITRKVITKVANLPIDNMQVYIQEMLLQCLNLFSTCVELGVNWLIIAKLGKRYFFTICHRLSNIFWHMLGCGCSHFFRSSLVILVMTN